MARSSHRLLLLLITLLALLPPGLASAHTALLRSSPAPGQRLERPPAAVELRFNKPVSAAFAPVVVRDSSGRQVDRGDARVDPADPTRITVSLKELPEGPYTARYRVSALDGHLIEGALSFTVAPPVGSAQAGPTVTPTPPEPQQPAAPPAEAAPRAEAVPPASAVPVHVGVGLAHGLAQFSAALLAGLPLFLGLVWLPVERTAPRRPTLWAAAIALLLIAAGLAEISLYAVQAAGEAWSLPVFLRALTGTRVGRFWLLRAGLGILAAAALTRAGRTTSPAHHLLLALPGSALLLTFSLQSHAMATGRLLPVLVDWLHLLAIAAWVGGLAGFALLIWPGLAPLAPPERSRLLGEAVPRFSRLALLSVLLLLLTGLYSALLHVPALPALWSTAYGRSLVWKLLLLTPVLLLGGYNFLGKGRGPFRLAVSVELALLLAIFVAAGFLTNLPTADLSTAFQATGGSEQCSTADHCSLPESEQCSAPE